MNTVNPKYLINDIRGSKEFKKHTFGKFLKSDVLSALSKSIKNGELAESAHWSVEMLVSGHIMELFDKFIVLTSKLINIRNPFLIQLVYFKYSKLMEIINKNSNNNEKDYDPIELRNDQRIRNMIAEICSLLLLSEHEEIPKSSKINKLDFRIDNFQNQIINTDISIVSSLLKNGDPPELKIVAGELAHYLKEKNASYNKCDYWLNWLFEWEKINSKTLDKFECGHRPKTYIKPQFHNDFIWLVWDIIFQEININRRNSHIINTIKPCYELYCFNFNNSNRKKKLALIHHCFLILTRNVDWKLPICTDENYPKLVQTCANINLLFEEYKKNEILTINNNNKLPYQVANYNNYLVPMDKNVKDKLPLNLSQSPKPLSSNKNNKKSRNNKGKSKETNWKALKQMDIAFKL